MDEMVSLEFQVVQEMNNLGVAVYIQYDADGQSPSVVVSRDGYRDIVYAWAVFYAMTSKVIAGQLVDSYSIPLVKD